MKYRVLLLMLSILSFAGCSDFLEESSLDEVRPTSIDDLMQIMVGEVYPMSNTVRGFQDFLTDDVECFGAQNQEILEAPIENLYRLFSWDDEMFNEGAGTHDRVNAWKVYYNKIMGANTVLEHIDQVKGDQVNKDNLRGQALTMRAWYYFSLVNLFGLPYNYGNPEENPGVPLKLEMEITGGYYTRNSVAEVYKQIEEDLLAGVDLLEKNPLSMSEYKISVLAAKSILSRVYLYMENWDEALKYANEVLAVKPTLTALASAEDAAFAWQGKSPFGVYNVETSDEVIWIYSNTGEIGSLYSAGGYNYRAAFGVSSDLMTLYEFVNDTEKENYMDLRPFMYFVNSAYIQPSGAVYYQLYAFKGGKHSTTIGGKGIRTAELYLNRAEVYIRKYMASGDDSYRQLALDDLNNLREHRYDTRNVAYEPKDIRDAEELFEFYKNERRRELCFEDHRWFDLRRYGMPSITHSYFISTDNREEITLRKDDPRYALPIPRVALNRNPLLVQNER